jgi:PAS domain S-box-containing protein
VVGDDVEDSRVAVGISRPGMPAPASQWALAILGLKETGDDALTVDGEPEATLRSVLAGDSELRHVSPALERMLGYSFAELAACDLTELIHPDDLIRAAEEFSRLLEDDPIPNPIALRARDRDGHWINLEILATNMLGDPAVRAFIANVRDDSARVRAELDLADAEERFRLAFDHAPIGKAIVDLDGTLVRVNRALASLFGRPQHELEDMTIREITYPEDWGMTAVRTQQLTTGDIDGYELEKRLLRSDASVIWVNLSASLVRGVNGEPLHMIVQLQDITERMEMQERLDYLALHDELTGLHNRTWFERELQTALDNRAGDDESPPLVVLFLDLDNFRLINQWA